MASIIQEFKAFAMRGNVVDMAVGIVIGTAFGKIITSLVEDVMMPPLGLAMGGVDFSNLFLNLGGVPYESLSAAQAAGAATIRYGLFLNTLLNFTIVAMAMFIVIKVMNRLKRDEVATVKEVTTRPCPECLSEIPKAARRCSHCSSLLQAAH